MYEPLNVHDALVIYRGLESYIKELESNKLTMPSSKESIEREIGKAKIAFEKIGAMSFPKD